MGSEISEIPPYIIKGIKITFFAAINFIINDIKLLFIVFQNTQILTYYLFQEIIDESFKARQSPFFCIYYPVNYPWNSVTGIYENDTLLIKGKSKFFIKILNL